MTSPAALTAPRSAAVRALPIRPRPAAGDTPAAYVRRLARANHLRPAYLNRYLRDDATGQISIDMLAALAARPVSSLTRAFSQDAPVKRRYFTGSRRQELFGAEAVAKRMDAVGAFGKPLQDMINGYAYGDLWQRPGLSPKLRSLTMVAMMAAVGRPNELRVHLNGAVKNGCTADEVREVLLQVALYCGLPLSIEAHTIAQEVLAAHGVKAGE